MINRELPEMPASMNLLQMPNINPIKFYAMLVEALKHSRLKININPESMKIFACTNFSAVLLSGDMQCRFHYNLNF